jgi:hypothetical protein
MEPPTIGKALRTLFWFLVLAMSCRFSLLPALAFHFRDVVLFRLPEFEAVLFLVSLAISIKLFLFPTKRSDYNGKE